VYFYELHEGDGDLFSDMLLTRETEMEPDVFFDVVQTIRRRIQDSYDTETLVEAIAQELEQDYDFIAVTDDRLTAAINVSKIEDDNFLADLGETEDDDDDDDDDDDEDDDDVSAVRTLLVDLEPNPDLRMN
jgi:hypothetical protein